MFELELISDDRSHNRTGLVTKCSSLTDSGKCSKWITVKQEPTYLENDSNEFHTVMYDMNLSVRYVTKQTGQKSSEILDKIQKIQFIAPYKPKNLEIYQICKDSIGTFLKYLNFKKV